MKKQSCVRWEWVVATLFVVTAASAGYADEKPWSRAWRLEAYPTIQFLGSDEVPFLDGTDIVKVEDTPFFGGGMGFNLNDHFNLNGELTGGRTDLVGHPAGLPEVHRREGATLWFGDINLDYNILKSRFTPLVTGGAGFAKWRNHEEGRGEVHWAYNLGAGARWDITNNLALRVTYRATWTKLENADEAFRFGGVVASLIYMFE
jgi:opacity protein-like surface antigen